VAISEALETQRVYFKPKANTTKLCFFVFQFLLLLVIYGKYALATKGSILTSKYLKKFS